MLAVLGCGAPPRPATDDAAYAQAERALSQGDLSLAQTHFEALAAGTQDPERSALYRYRLATIARRAGRGAEAERLFAEVAAGDSTERAPLADYQQAVAAFEAGQGDGALRALALAHPDSVAADKAVKFLATHVQAPDHAAQIVAWLEDLAARHPQAAVADNALWWAAEVRLFHQDDLPGARTTLRHLARTHPESPLTDDAIWRLGQLYLRQGAWTQAAETLGALLEIRNETSYFVGSYRSPYLDDAALLIARIRHHGLRDPAGAVLAFEAMLADFPTSVLVDDALLGLAQARFAAGQERLGRAALQQLVNDHPQSRHAEGARALLQAPRPPATDFDEALLAPEPWAPVRP